MGIVEYKEDQNSGAETITIHSRLKVEGVKVSMVRGKHLELKLSMPFDVDVFAAFGDSTGEYGSSDFSVSKAVDVDKESEKQNYILEFEQE